MWPWRVGYSIPTSNLKLRQVRPRPGLKQQQDAEVGLEILHVTLTMLPKEKNDLSGNASPTQQR